MQHIKIEGVQVTILTGLWTVLVTAESRWYHARGPPSHLVEVSPSCDVDQRVQVSGFETDKMPSHCC